MDKNRTNSYRNGKCVRKNWSCKWVGLIRSGRTNLKDCPHARPTIASTLENITKIQNMVLENRRLTKGDLVKPEASD